MDTACGEAKTCDSDGVAAILAVRGAAGLAVAERASRAPQATHRHKFFQFNADFHGALSCHTRATLRVDEGDKPVLEPGDREGAPVQCRLP
jgi:hypothetical protein